MFNDCYSQQTDRQTAGLALLLQDIHNRLCVPHLPRLLQQPKLIQAAFTSLVGVQCESLPLIGTLDLLRGGLLVDSEHLVMRLWILMR